MRARIAAGVLTQAAGAPSEAAPDATGPISTSPVVWVVAAILLLVAAYFLIRLLEWDLMNEETPNQEDPLLK